MIAIARSISRAGAVVSKIVTLKQLALFCAAGLLVSVLTLTYSVDLSPGFF